MKTKNIPNNFKEIQNIFETANYIEPVSTGVHIKELVDNAAAFSTFLKPFAKLAAKKAKLDAQTIRILDQRSDLLRALVSE